MAHGMKVGQKGFHSSDFVFRQSVVGAAFAAIGIGNVPLVREPLFFGVLRDKKDRNNVRPSVPVHIKPSLHSDAKPSHAKEEMA